MDSPTSPERVYVALGSNVGDRDAHLAHARARLTQAQHLKALGELSAEVAHEFGNLLQAIGLQAAALRRQSGLPEMAGRALWSIKQAVATQAPVTFILSPLLTGGKVFEG